MTTIFPASEVDVLVVGAGPAGSVLAARLARAGTRVLLVEASRFDAPRFGEFLPPVTCAKIRATDILADGWMDRHRRVHEFVSRWGTDEYVARNYIFDAFGAALVLDRTALDAAMADGAARAGAELWLQTRVRGLLRGPVGWEVTVERDGQPVLVRARYVALSTGRRSGLLRQLPVHRERRDELWCFGCWVPGIEEESSDPRPAVETYARGWVYSARAPCGGTVVCMFSDRDLVPTGAVARDTRAMATEIAGCELARERLGAVGTRYFAAPSGTAVTRPVAGEGWCLVGDCAQAYDPLSSQGIHEAVMGAEIVADGLLRSGDLADSELREYTEYLDRSLAAYNEQRSQYYGRERRWVGARFWARRQ